VDNVSDVEVLVHKVLFIDFRLLSDIHKKSVKPSAAYSDVPKRFGDFQFSEIRA
jgi:hypothetical protein